MRGSPIGRSARTLERRLVLTLVLVSILPLALIGLGGAALERDAIAQQSARELSGLARGLAGQIDSYLDVGPLSDARAIAALPEIASMDPARQAPLLRAMFQEYSHFARITALGPGGQILASAQPLPITAVPDRPSLRAAAQQGRQSWEVVSSVLTGELTLIIYTPVRDDSRHVVGVLGTSVDMTYFDTVLGRVQVGEGGRALIVEGSGRVLVHPDPTKIGHQYPVAASAVAGGGTERYVDGGSWIAAAAPVTATGWLVIVERPEAEVLAPADRTWRLALSVVAASAVLTILVAAGLARRLARPLGDLAGAARALAAGEPDAPLPKVDPEDGELGALVGAFATMRGAVTSRERALLDETRAIETLYRVGSTLAGELDLQRLVQHVTDAATEVSGAQFGAFFYNLVNERGESYTLYTISGAPLEAFSNFPMPRNTHVFAPTFKGERTVRMADVTADPRYGKNPPFNGMPKGHLPVRSYLAVPVVSRSGEVMGGLFFGHAEVGVFTERAERIVEGIASQAAVAIDNARLFGSVQDALRARDQFLSIASHELKTPLTTIRGRAQMLLRAARAGKLDEARMLSAAESLDVAAGRLATLVEDLLDVSRIRTGQLALRTTRIDVGEIVEAVVGRQREHLGADHTLVLTRDPGGQYAEVDSDRLEQVITNLIDNAVKYSPGGGEVHATVRREGHEVTIEVVDQGIGLPPGAAESIFEPFGRASNATVRHLPGMGLGLYICRNIVELHGGSIRAESPGEEQGTTMRVCLPDAPEDPAAEQRTASEC